MLLRPSAFRARLTLAIFAVGCLLAAGAPVFVRADDRLPPALDPRGLDHAATIGQDIALFTPSGYDPAKTPSLALQAEPKKTGALPAGWALIPSFTEDDRGFLAAASLAVPAGSSLYGTGEVAGPLLRNGHTITLWNTDNYGYSKHDGKQLYQSHPWVLGVRPDGTAFGVLFDTTWKSQLTTADDRITLASEGAPFRVIVIDRDSPQAVLSGLTELIGTLPLPPEWALGFHQCRYSYYPDAQVRRIADEFRERHIPCDVIWLDIDYMNGFRIFTFDKSRFPDPKATNEYLHSEGYHSVWMIDPGVKADPDYSVFKSGDARHLWVQTKDGQDYHGKVWPGECVFPDFTMPETRAWWSGLYKDFIAQGIDGVWNDMNEPAVFNGPDGSMPEDNVHRGGGDLPAGPHRMYHNVYGELMTQATRAGILAARPEKRPFVLTRANFLGGQRNAATWTGDNEAKPEFLAQSVPMSINLGLSGQPLSGPDIGGFEGKGDANLYADWIGTGAFYPFCRAHASNTSPHREPWSYGPEVEDVARTALQRRYRLLPYLYTITQRASATGEPIMQPVFFADPKDPDLRAEDKAFLFGRDLLVVPKWGGATHLPKGIWQEVSLLDDPKRENDPHQPTLKIRGGAIVPLGAVIESTTETSLKPLTLLVCLDATGHAQGDLYEDEGDGFAYQKGGYSLSHYTAAKEGDVVTVRQTTADGGSKPLPREVVVQVVGPGGFIGAAKGSLTDGIHVPVHP